MARVARSAVKGEGRARGLRLAQHPGQMSRGRTHRDRRLRGEARQVLKEFGNMSSATALFLLEAALADGAYGRYLLAAFGPSFSAYFIVVEL